MAKHEGICCHLPLTWRRFRHCADRFQHGNRRVTVVAVPDETAAEDIVAGLVDEGAGLVELCGGFGPVPAAPVIKRIGDRAPVGIIGYGVESLPRISRFHLNFLAGEVRSEAFIVLVPGTDPVQDRVVHDHGNGTTFTAVSVPDIAAAEQAAAEFAEADVGLIELFGDFGARDAGRVFECGAPAASTTGLIGLSQDHTTAPGIRSFRFR